VTRTHALLFLQNITGFMVGRDYERRGITKDGAKLIMAVAGARCEVHGRLQRFYGAGTYGMSGRASIRASCLPAQSQISVMGAEQAAGVLTDIKAKQLARNGERLSEPQLAAIREPILEDYRERRVPIMRHRSCGTTAFLILSTHEMPWRSH